DVEAANGVVCADTRCKRAAIDSYAGRRACKFQLDLENRMAPRPRPAAKPSIPKITTVRKPTDETVFELVAGGVDTSASGVVEETLSLRLTFFSAGSEFSFADSKFSETSGGASASGRTEF